MIRSCSSGAQGFAGGGGRLQVWGLKDLRLCLSCGSVSSTYMHKGYTLVINVCSHCCRIQTSLCNNRYSSMYESMVQSPAVYQHTLPLPQLPLKMGTVHIALSHHCTVHIALAHHRTVHIALSHHRTVHIALSHHRTVHIALSHHR